MIETFTKSNEYYDNASKNIPLASQTFSKSIYHYPKGASPLFIKKGKGCHVWDIDDNQYIDFVGALLSISLGYQDSDVDNAVIHQMKNGVNFSLPTQLENELAERLIENIPCAQMVRFGKNGSDVTSAAIRLARAYTGREKVVVCGYHGWQDWYIGSTTRDLGVPKCVKNLTLKTNYNDILALEKLFTKHTNNIAAVILEPMTFDWPKNNYLEKVISLCQKYGAISIFDEMITGFRFSMGGASEYFKVTPDLATFGKGMANGYPLSAIVGKKEIMMLMEDIFFSGTFGGEALSLAASIATIDKMKKQKVHGVLEERGKWLKNKVRALIENHRLSDIISCVGHPSWTMLDIKGGYGYCPLEIKTAFIEQMISEGILTLGSHNMMFSHDTDAINQLIIAYDKVFFALKNALQKDNLKRLIKGQMLQQVFKVR